MLSDGVQRFAAASNDPPQPIMIFGVPDVLVREYRSDLVQIAISGIFRLVSTPFGIVAALNGIVAALIGIVAEPNGIVAALVGIIAALNGIVAALVGIVAEPNGIVAALNGIVAALIGIVAALNGIVAVLVGIIAVHRRTVAKPKGNDIATVISAGVILRVNPSNAIRRDMLSVHPDQPAIPLPIPV